MSRLQLGCPLDRKDIFQENHAAIRIVRKRYIYFIFQSTNVNFRLVGNI